MATVAYPDLRVVIFIEPTYVCQTNTESSHISSDTDVRVSVEKFDAVTSSGNSYMKTAHNSLWSI